MRVTMQYILIILVLYAVFFFADILPSIKIKRWKPLRFTIPVFVITLILNFMIGFGVQLISPAEFIENAVKALFG